MTVHDHVMRARARFVRAGIAGPIARLDAEVLARHVLGWDRATFLLNRHHAVPESFVLQYGNLLERREQREPVHLILGHREFWGLEFEVSRDVLVPRPETELILEEALSIFAEGTPPTRIVDAGTGSGCLAVALALEFPSAVLEATDISPAALEVARRNAVRFDVAGRIRFRHARFLEGLIRQVDLVVSNPPYVPAASAPALPREVREHEPATALFGGADGLDGFKELFAQADRQLASGGWLLVEFGFDQGAAVQRLVDACRRLSVVRVREDLQGIPRVAVIRASDRD